LLGGRASELGPDHRKVPVDDLHQPEQVLYRAGQRHLDDADPGQAGRHLGQASRVGPVAGTQKREIRPYPEQIRPLECAGTADGTQDRDTQRRQCPGRVPLLASAHVAGHPGDDGALWRHCEQIPYEHHVVHRVLCGQCVDRDSQALVAAGQVVQLLMQDREVDGGQVLHGVRVGDGR
jgi:hypothetical protein